MSKIGLHCFYIVTDHQGIDGKAMPKIVKAHIFNACSVGYGFEMLYHSSSY